MEEIKSWNVTNNWTLLQLHLKWTFYRHISVLFFYTLSLLLLALKKYVQLYKKNCSKMMLIHVLVSIIKMLMMILLRTFCMKKKTLMINEMWREHFHVFKLNPTCILNAHQTIERHYGEMKISLKWMKGNSMFDFAEHHASTIKMRTVKKRKWAEMNNNKKKMLNKCAGRAK